MNKSGKALTIFLVVIAVLLVSLTAISVFFFLKEVELRRAAEANLDQVRAVQSQMQDELKKTKDQLVVYQQKVKEADENIANLMSELDLDKGVKEELNTKNQELTQQLDAAQKAKDDLRVQMSQDLSAAEEKIVDLQKQLADLEMRNKESEDLRKKTEAEYQKIKAQFESSGGVAPVNPAVSPAAAATPPANVELDKIVVANPTDRKGKVINIDTDSNFVIVSLGKDDGIEDGSLLSIYHGEKYLGDVKVTRVLKEMCAADFVPPFTIDQVQRDDRAVQKK